MKTLSATDFEAIDASQLQDEIALSEPQSYLHQVMASLVKNKAAMFSALIIVLVVLMALLGPLLWRVDPARQNLAEISLPPIGSRSALIVDHQQSWPLIDTADLSMQVVDNALNITVFEANTERVRLRWQPVVNAETYRVYRHLLKPSGAYDLGLPLAELKADQHRFEDRVNLTTQQYFYSVLVVTEDGMQDTFETLAVMPAQAISLWDVQLSALESGLEINCTPLEQIIWGGIFWRE